MIVARPRDKNEPCLITSKVGVGLCLYTLDGEVVVRQNAPQAGWCYDSLEQVAEQIVLQDDPLGNGEENPLKFGWDAYLGEPTSENWVGCSEV